MDYLTAWQDGCSDGMTIAIDQINKWCGTNFQKISEVIVFINKLQNEVQHDQS